MVMGSGWSELPLALGRTVGARACICHRLDGSTQPAAWLAPELAARLGAGWRPPVWQLGDELCARLLEQGTLRVAPVAALGVAADELAAGVALGARVAGEVPHVVWLGFERESQLDAERLEGLRAALLALVEVYCVRYRRFFDHLPAVFIVIGMDAVVRDCNAHIARLGYAREEVIGQRVAMFFGPGERERLRARLMADGAAHFQTVMLHRSGEGVFVDLTAAVVRDAEGQPHEIVSVGRELGEERKLDHHRRLEAVGRLISGIAHELNNPLLTVLGNAEMLAETKLSASARRRAERVLAGARRCQDVVDGLLRLRLKHRELESEVELEPVVRRALDSVAAELASIKPHVELRVEENLPAVRGDAVDLEQAVAHLLRNAYQAVQGLADGHIAVTLERADRAIRIAVQDSGPGMAPDVLERAFEPFFTTREVGVGKGLGLAIALGIMHDHGGHIELLSDGRGVRAVASLPLRADASPR
jgi:two-component system NtrC family sensor kinase